MESNPTTGPQYQQRGRGDVPGRVYTWTIQKSSTPDSALVFLLPRFGLTWQPESPQSSCHRELALHGGWKHGQNADGLGVRLVGGLHE